MSEETYSESKTNVSGSGQAARVRLRRGVTIQQLLEGKREIFVRQALLRNREMRTFAVSRPGRAAAPEYAQWKASLSVAVDEIKSEIRTQHQQTRGEVENSKRDVLAAIKSSPAAYVKLMCEFGVLALLFALAVRFPFAD